MAPYIRATMARFYGWSSGTGTESVSGNQRSQKTGRRRSINFASGSRPGTTRSLTSSGKERNCNSRIGWSTFWRTTQSRQSGRKKRTKQTNVRPGISKRPLVEEQLVILRQMTSSTIFGGGFRREYNSEPPRVSFRKTCSSRRQSIRNCEFFGVC